MEKENLKKFIEVAAGKVPADYVIKNVKIVDVYNSCIVENKDIAICNGYIAGIGEYQGEVVIDAGGQFAAPGFIDGHIHIESSHVTPEEIGRLLVPHGSTTIIADPHEIVNVCGMDGMTYMLEASKNTVLDIKYMLPSCVPATDFEHTGAVIDAAVMEEPMKEEEILGLGEFMDYPGVIEAKEGALDKLLVAIKEGKIIDGHSPGLAGNALNAYAAAGIHTDHECSTVEEMNARISRGLYVQMREGSACQDLRTLLKGVTLANSRRCLLCSDDRQPKTIFELGHIDNHLRVCVEEGIDPIIAIQMASLNAAQCYRLYDRGAIAPGLRGDIVFFDNLTDFHISRVFIKGQEVAKDGVYLPEVKRHDISTVRSKFYVKDFSIDKLKLNLKSNHVHVIDILPGGVLTEKTTAKVTLTNQGDFKYNPEQDIAKIAVIERHNNTGNVAVGFLRGYGIRSGAIAISIAHDSHNIIAVGVSNEEMEFAVHKLIEQGGGIVLVNNQVVIDSMPLVIGGIMCDQTGEWVNEKLTHIHENAHDVLGISHQVEPIMTLCFMSLPVIPELKITDMGLFDVTQFEFITIEV